LATSSSSLKIVFCRRSCRDDVRRHAGRPISNKRTTHGVFGMTNKPKTPHDTKKQADVAHPGMMGDGTEEQNLNQRGNPAARIKKKDVDAAFAKQRPKK
jgi:hypothetical protein